MRKLILVLMVLALIAGCNSKPKGEPPVPVKQHETVQPKGLSGTVLQTMDAGGYTYALMQIADAEVWAAGPVTDLEIGSEYELMNPMLMNNFASKTLDKTFDEIYFISGYITPGMAVETAIEKEMQSTHAHVSDAPAEYDFSGIVTPDGGHNVADIIANRANYAGQEITLRGIVVKSSASIMNRNWLHIRDGSGEEGSNDLTITSNDMANAGDTVLITGKLAIDKDFGAGYFYNVILEEASVVVE
jgi:hypothetical protein